jgi:hypothetical protein
MVRMLTMLALFAALAALTGCEPFETELTLNADGTGKLTQKGTLTPAARAMLMQGYRLANSYRNILLADAGKDWNGENPNAGVKVLRYEPKVADNGALAFNLEVTFESLEKLGATVWGQALQLGVAEADGALKLSCEDPARFAANATILRDMRREGVSGRRRIEYQAMMDMLLTSMKGFKLRTVLVLPAAAVSAEGAALSEDRKRVTYELTIGEEPGAVNAWLAKPPATVMLPAGFAGLKPFEPPPPLAQMTFGNPTAAKPKPAVPTKIGEGFSLKPTYLNWSLTRSIQLTGDDREPQRNEGLNVTLNLYAPENANLLQEQYRHDQTSPHAITTAKDDLGNDLRNPDQRIWLHTYGGTFGQNVRRQPDQPIGSLQLNLKAPGKDAKTLVKVEGYAVLSQIAETDTTEIKPLKENLDKEYVLGPQTIRFTAVRERAVDYILSVREMPPQIKWKGPDGADLTTQHVSSSFTNGKNVTTQHFAAALPDGVYAVITYAAKVEQVKVPFVIENIKLP